MIQRLYKTTAKLWHNVLAGAILTVQALWLLQMMRLDRGSIHSHPCVPSSSVDPLLSQSSPSPSACTTRTDSAETSPALLGLLGLFVLIMIRTELKTLFTLQREAEA